MAFDQEAAETIAPVLAMIGQEARLDPNWTCHMLEAVNGRVLPGFHRQQRDTAASDAERICYGLKLAVDPGAITDDLVQLAHFYASNEELVGALYWVTKSLETQPAQGELLRFKASILERLGLFEQALQSAHEAKSHGADLEPICADIDRINQLLSSYLQDSIRAKYKARSLPELADLLEVKSLRVSEFIKLIGKIIKIYAKRN
jgi:hypothetical protein